VNDGEALATLRSFDLDEEDGAGKAWVKEFKKRRHEASSATSPIKSRATDNHRFAAPGEDQEPPSSTARGKSTPRRRFTLMSVNEIHPILSTLSGRQIMGRFERRYIPRRNDVREWAEVLSNWDRAVVDACHADQEESAAFRNGPGIAGLSWLKVSVDYLEDPEGMIVIEEIPLWRMLWPARETRKKNLLDRDWQIEGDWYTLAKFKAMWPTKVKAVRDEIGKAPNWSDSDPTPAKSSRIPWEGMDGSSEGTMAFFDGKRRQIWVERYEWREPSSRHFVVVPPEGMSYADLEEALSWGEATIDDLSVEEMSPREFRDYDAEVRTATGEGVPLTRYIRKERMVYRYAYLAGDTVLEQGDIEIGRFTYEALTGYPFVQPDVVDWRSITDALRMPQIWINIFLTMMVKYMQVNPKGVLFVERGVFKSRNEGMSQFSSTGGMIEVERGKISGSPNPPFLFHSGGRSPMDGFVQSMLTFAQDLLPRSVGFNHAALGQLGPDLRRISGQVVEHVRDAAVASHAELYDSLATARQRIGMILLGILGKVLGLKHLRRVVGEEAFVDEIKDPATGEMQQIPKTPPPDLLDEAVWSVAVEETKPAPDRMRFVWESLTESGGLGILAQIGALDRRMAIEMMPDLPEDMRERRLREIEQEEEMMQQQAAAPAEPGAAEPGMVQ
jgi:hypothetical protein